MLVCSNERTITASHLLASACASLSAEDCRHGVAAPHKAGYSTVDIGGRLSASSRTSRASCGQQECLGTSEPQPDSNIWKILAQQCVMIRLLLLHCRVLSCPFQQCEEDEVCCAKHAAAFCQEARQMTGCQKQGSGTARARREPSEKSS